MPSARGETWGFAALLVAFCVLVGVHRVRLPLFEGPDEVDNLQFVRYLALEGRLPEPTLEIRTELENLGRGHMPPLWFLANVPLFRAVGAGEWEATAALNPEFLRRRGGARDAGRSRDEILAEPYSRLNYRHGRDEIRPLTGAAWDVRILRLGTFPWACLALWAVWRAARIVLPAENGAPDGRGGRGRSWAPLGAAALLAFTPQFQHLAATITMDLMLAAWGSLALLCALQWCAGEARPVRAAALAGLFAGLACLTKLNGAVLVPALALAAVLAHRRGRAPISAVAACFGFCAAVAAAWYGWTWIESGHPLWTWKYQAISPFHHPDGQTTSALDAAKWAWFAIVLFLTWLADFGWTAVWFPVWVNALVAALLLAGAVAGALALRRGPCSAAGECQGNRVGLAFLAGCAALILLAEVGFNVGYTQPQARHLYPFLPALIVPIAVGLARWGLLGRAAAFHALLSLAAFPMLLERLRPEGWNQRRLFAATDAERRVDPDLREGDAGASVSWLAPAEGAAISASSPPELVWSPDVALEYDLALAVENPRFEHRPWRPDGYVFRALRDLGEAPVDRVRIPSSFWDELPSGTRVYAQVIALGPDGSAVGRSSVRTIAKEAIRSEAKPAWRIDDVPLGRERSPALTPSRIPAPPSAEEVASRALILKYLIVKAMASPPPEVISALAESSSDAEQREFWEESRRWQAECLEFMRTTGLWSKMTLAEQEYLVAPAAEVDPQMRVDASWWMESEVCMLWALGHVADLPPYDTEAPVDHLDRVPDGSVDEILRGARLRDRSAIDRARDVAELWHWRSRTRQLAERDIEPKLPEGETLDSIVRSAAERAAADGLFAAPIDGDFPAFERAYRDVTQDEWSRATSIVMERHKALNWLSGYAPGNRWDETPTDT